MLLFKREHVALILSGRKTQTRRTWTRPRVKVGGVYRCQMRLFEEPFARVRVTALRREPLWAMPEEDALREGYQTLADYWTAFTRIYGFCDPRTLVWVVTFEVVSGGIAADDQPGPPA